MLVVLSAGPPGFSSRSLTGSASAQPGVDGFFQYIAARKAFQFRRRLGTVFRLLRSEKASSMVKQRTSSHRLGLGRTRLPLRRCDRLPTGSVSATGTGRVMISSTRCESGGERWHRAAPVSLCCRAKRSWSWLRLGHAGIRALGKAARGSARSRPRPLDRGADPSRLQEAAAAGG